jgi:hypothetical protein
MPVLDLLADPPLMAPAPDRQRQLNYWPMSKRVVPPTFALTATGIALGVYALLVWLCDLGSMRIGLLRTFGLNPLVAYVLSLYVLGPLLWAVWPDDRSWAWGLRHMLVWFGLTYLSVWLLEKWGAFLRL